MTLKIILKKNGQFEKRFTAIKDTPFLSDVLLVDCPPSQTEISGVDKYILVKKYSKFRYEYAGYSSIEHIAIYEFEKNIKMYLNGDLDEDEF